MANLQQRVTKLEKAHPVEELPLSEEQIKRVIFELCESGWDQLESQLAWAALHYPEFRKYFPDENLWLHDRTHRICVFLALRGIICRMPDWDTDKTLKRLFDIFGRGWGDDIIPQADIDFVLAESKNIDLGPEQPWLKGYLECSGQALKG